MQTGLLDNGVTLPPYLDWVFFSYSEVLMDFYVGLIVDFF